MIYGYSELDGVFQVWLDAWSSEKVEESWPDDAHGVVCERHSLSMSAPLGWDLVDRRESVPRLFVPRPVLVHSRSTEDSGSLRRKRVTDLPAPQLFADLHKEDRDSFEETTDVTNNVTNDVTTVQSVENETSDQEIDRTTDRVDVVDTELSSLLDATGPLLRRAFGKRNTGRHDASKELMRPTTHQIIDESA